MRDFSLFLSNVGQGIRTAVNPMGEHLWAKQRYEKSRPGTEIEMAGIAAGCLYEELSGVTRNKLVLGQLYRIES